MLDFPSLFKIKKEKATLLLDIGNEAVKAQIFQEKDYNPPTTSSPFSFHSKRAPKKITTLGNSLEYLDYYGMPDVRNSERDILEKVILKTFRNLGLQNLRLKFDIFVLLGLPADILRTRVISQNFKRGEPKKIIDEKEEKEIFQKIIDEARKKACRIYSENSGILPEDLQFVSSKINGIKIDGYEVPVLQKYSGRNLDFKILTAILPKYYLKEIEDICQTTGLHDRKIVHEIEALIPYFKEKPDGIFLDVGGEKTQIFLVKSSKPEATEEFETGGKTFSRALSEKLGLRLPEARILKERYSRKELSMESMERIKEILYPVCQTWFKNLKLKLKEMKPEGFLPRNIVLFGEGGRLPEISEILEKGNWNDFFLNLKPNIKNLNNSQINLPEL